MPQPSWVGGGFSSPQPHSSPSLPPQPTSQSVVWSLSGRSSPVLLCFRSSQSPYTDPLARTYLNVSPHTCGPPGTGSGTPCRSSCPHCTPTTSPRFKGG